MNLFLQEIKPLPADPNVALRKDISNYIQGWNITRNVNWLLDFAIIGFPKTGTSTLMHYLSNQTDSVFIFEHERCGIAWGQTVRLLEALHKNYRENIHMGIKCPSNLESDNALKEYDKDFPETKFIIGLRNPVLWFESFYNFRIDNGYNMKRPQELIGPCRKGYHHVCTNRANFGKFLKRIQPNRKVFLYDVAQLRNDDSLRSERFRQDLSKFLGLDRKLDQPMIWHKPGKGLVEEGKIDICDDQYAELRKILREHASNSSSWIMSTFINHPNVQISSPEYFSSILESWHLDPCPKTK